MTDPRRDVLAALIHLTQQCLETLSQGSLEIEAMIAPREQHFARLIALDAELGPAPEELLPALRRLAELNTQLDSAVRRSIGETTERLKGVARGRKGLVGYRESTRHGPGTRLGKG